MTQQLPPKQGNRKQGLWVWVAQQHTSCETLERGVILGENDYLVFESPGNMRVGYVEIVYTQISVLIC